MEEGFNRLFRHDPDWKIVICYSHQYAIPPDQIGTHLNANYRQETKAVRDGVYEYIQQLPDLAWSQGEVPYSNGQVLAIPGIPIYLDGFYCTGST